MVNTTAGLKRVLTFLFGEKTNDFLASASVKLVPQVTNKTPCGNLRFFCPGRLPLWRARSLLTKEPETIRWIEGLKPGSVLWDVGSNVGTYSIYAAQRGLSILAFEPSPGNFYILNKNIEINFMEGKVAAYCIALSDQTGLGKFYMADTGLGSALSSFGKPIDWQGNQFKAKSALAACGMTMDDFIADFNPPFPNAIKIDVDGIEECIISGAAQTLKDKRVNSVLVELDIRRRDYVEGVTKFMNQSGFVLCDKPETQYNHIYARG